MSKLRAAYQELVNTFKEEGLNVTINIWVHSHLNDSEVLTEEKALSTVRIITQDTPEHDLELYAKENRGMASGTLPDNYSSINIVYNRKD